MALIDAILAKQKQQQAAPVVGTPAVEAPVVDTQPVEAPRKRVSLVDQLDAQDKATAPVATPQATPVQPVAAEPNSWGSIIGRNVDNLQANLGGTVEAVGEATGSKFLADAGKQYREEQLDEAKQYGEPDHTSYKDVDLDDIGSVGAYLKNVVGGAAPALGAQLASMGAGAAAGRAVGAIGGPVGQGLGAILGGGLASMGINIGALQNQIKEIDPDAKSPWTSILGGTGMAALDVVGLKGVAAPLVRTLGRDAAYSALTQSGVTKGLALEAVKGAAVEAATSATQSVAQDVLAAKATDTRLTPEKVVENAINAAIGGGVVGGAIRGGGHILDQAMSNATVIGTAHQGKTFSEGSTDEPGIARKIWSTLGGSAVEALNPIARTSTSGEEFIRQFRPDMTGEKATGKTIFEDNEIMAGKWRSEFDKVTEGMKDKDIAEMYDRVSDPDYVPKGKDAQFRALMDDVPLTAKSKGGLDTVGYVRGYMPFRLDPKTIMNNASQFLSDITPYFKSPEAAKTAMDEWVTQQNSENPGDVTPPADRRVSIDPLTGSAVIRPQFQSDGNPDGMRSRMNQGKSTPKFGHLEMNRAFGAVPQKILNKYVKEQTTSQKTEALHDYFEGAAHRVSYAAKFGGDSEKANAMIAKTVAESQAAGKQVRQADVDRMYNLLDAYNGLYGRIKNEKTRSAQAVTSAVLTMATLPFATIASFSEFLTPAIRGDIGAALMSMAPTWGELGRSAARALLKGVPKSEFAQVASEANLGLAASLNVASQRLGATMFNRGAATATKWFFIGNGLSFMTHIQRTYAAKTADYIFDRNLNALANGLPITSAKGAHMANQLRSMGVDVKTNADAKALYAPATPSKVRAQREARILAVKRFTSQAVLEPNISDTPLWMNHGHLQLLAMLKRYPTAFTNTILPQVFRKANPMYAGSFTNAAVGATSAAFLVGAMLSVGYIQDEMKQINKSGEIDYDDDRTEMERFRDVASMTLAPIQMQYISDALFSNKYGVDPATALGGPAVGMATNVVKKVVSPTISHWEDNPTSGYLWKFLYKQTPVRNWGGGEEWINDTFDLPTK
uniref:Particle protein n=3 Tax=unclassified bacterial viruses TaxID=12333 RepID=A0AAU6VZK8_9VIRU